MCFSWSKWRSRSSCLFWWGNLRDDRYDANSPVNQDQLFCSRWKLWERTNQSRARPRRGYQLVSYNRTSRTDDSTSQDCTRVASCLRWVYWIWRRTISLCQNLISSSRELSPFLSKKLPSHEILRLFLFVQCLSEHDTFMVMSYELVSSSVVDEKISQKSKYFPSSLDQKKNSLDHS